MWFNHPLTISATPIKIITPAIIFLNAFKGRYVTTLLPIRVPIYAVYHYLTNHEKLLDNRILLIHTYTYNNAYQKGRYFMRTTLNIEDKLLSKAAKLTGIKEKTSLVRLGLEALIASESSRRLAKLGGTEKKLLIPSRRRAAGS